MANQYRSVLASGSAGTGGDAVAANVLAGKTFTNDNGFDTGTMVNNGAVTQTLSAGQSYTIPEGYHNGSGTVTASASGAFDTVTAVASRASTQTNCGIRFTKAQLDGKTTITPTGISGTPAVYYVSVDGGAVGSAQSLATPYTIPSFDTSIEIYVSFNGDSGVAQFALS